MESPYVMVSRVKSIRGLIILQSFKKNRIDRRQSEDYRKERKRLSVLKLLTLQQCGCPRERQEAKDRLQLLIGQADA